MSAGLFARLARRARGETGGLQPLIPPIFAGGPTSTGLVEEEMQTPVRAQPMPAPTAQPPPAQPGPGTLDHTLLQPVPGQKLPPQPEITMRSDQPRSETGPQSILPQQVMPPRDAALAQPTPDQPARHDSSPALLVPQPTRSEAVPLPLADDSPRTVKIQVERAPQSGANELLLPRRAPEPTSRPMPAITTEPSDKKPAQSDPPVVRITIGRVELHAAQPAAAPAPAPIPQPHPGLSLEEYLRRLNEGKQ